MNYKYKAIEDFLEKKGLKLTNQRRSIIKQILAIKRHLTVDQITEILQKGGHTVSRATVYRMLAILKEGRMIDEHDFDQKKKFYESAVGRIHHDHLYCIGCGKIVEFHNDRIEKLQDEVIKKNKFVHIYHSHKIFGYCGSCSKTKH